MRFLARFQRLERARGPSPEGPGVDPERFSALEVAAPLPEVQGPPSGRFALPEVPLELDRGEEHQPFVRCQACGRDSQRGTLGCACGARLDTPEVAAFNAQLWSDLRARQREEHAAREQALGEDLTEAQRRIEQRHALGVELAREVAQRERGNWPPLPWWLASIWVGAVLLVLLRLHWPAALALAVGVLLVLGGWWWMQRPPGP